MHIIHKKKLHRSAPKSSIAQLHGWKKLQYIWDYYKLPLALLCLVLYAAGYLLYGHFTHKEVRLYAAFVNVAPSERLTSALSDEFLDAQNMDTAKNEFHLYKALHLTNDEANPYHEYTHASRMKILAAIDAEQLDVVLMDQEAFEAFSQNGYLCNLEEILSPDDSIPYTALAKEHPTGIALTQFPLIEQAGFDGTVYLGIIANSPRKETAVEYIRYLAH